MAAIAATYIAVGLALGSIWIVPEFRRRPDRGLAFELLGVVVGWPVFAIFVIALFLATKSK